MKPPEQIEILDKIESLSLRKKTIEREITELRRRYRRITSETYEGKGTITKYLDTPGPLPHGWLKEHLKKPEC